MRATHKPQCSWTRPKCNCGEFQLGLTKREGEVLRLLAAGLSRKEVGGKLGISTNTVEAHIYNIMRQANCSSAWILVLGMVKQLGAAGLELLPALPYQIYVEE